MFSNKVVASIVAVLICCVATAAAATSILVLAKAPSQPWVLPGAVGQVNMITSPGNFADTSAWQYTNIADTTFSTKIQAPDGTNTASKWIANTTNNVHSVSSKNPPGIVKITRAMNYKLVCFAKAGEYSRVTLDIQNLGGTSGVVATFDLIGGQVLAGGVGGAIAFGSGYTGIGTDVVNVGNGWWRIGMTFTSDTASAFMQSHNIDAAQGQAARSFSFAGNGSKGIWMWKCNLLPQAAWNHTTLAFDTEFTSPNASTIDFNNTKAAGYQWYLGGPWPNSTNYTSVTQAWRVAPQQVGSNFTYSGGGLAMLGDSAGTYFGLSLMTSAYTSGSSHVGTTFTPGGLFCASLKFDGTLMRSGQLSWPAFWSMAQEFLAGTASEFVEADHFEAGPTGTGTWNNVYGTLDWTISALVISSNHYQPNLTNANSDNQYHQYCDLWITASENGGIGYKQRYFDNTYLGSGDLTYSSGAGSQPASAPSNPNGVYSIAESQHFPLILSSWPGLTDYWQYVRVWQ